MIIPHVIKTCHFSVITETLHLAKKEGKKKAQSLEAVVMNALSLNPSGPPQYKQTQTEEFTSQHVILHRAQTTGTNLGL